METSRRLEASPGRTQAFLLASYAVRILAGLGTTALLGRHLAPGDFGFFAFIGSIIAVGALLLDLGTKSMAVREIAARPGREQPLVEALIAWRAILGGAILLGTAVLACAEDDWDRRAALLGAGAVLLLAAPACLQIFFQLRQAQGLHALFGSLNQILAFAVMALLVRHTTEGSRFAWVLLLRELAGVLIICWLAGRLMAFRPSPGFKGRNFRPFLRASLVLGLAVLGQALYFHADVFIVRAIRGETELGIYSAAYRPVNLLIAMAGMATAPLLPVFTAVVSRSRSRYRTLALASSAQSLAIGLAAAAAGAVLAPDALGVLYGGRYVDGAESATGALRWLVLAFSAACLGAPALPALLAAGRERTLVKLGMAGLALNVAGNLALVPSCGFEAAAATTAATEALVAAGALRALRRPAGPGAARRAARRAGPPWHLVPVPALAVAAPLLFIPGGPWVRLGAGALLFAAAAAAILLHPRAVRLRRQLRRAAALVEAGRRDPERGPRTG